MNSKCKDSKLDNCTTESRESSHSEEKSPGGDGSSVRRKIAGKSKCRYVLARVRHTTALRRTLTNLSSTTINA